MNRQSKTKQAEIELCMSDINKLRHGNIVFYEDAPNEGYPICLVPSRWPGERLESLSFDVPVTCDGMHEKFIKPLFFRCNDFFDQHKHLKCTEADIPQECQDIHQFQNWYKDTYGEEAEIRGGKKRFSEEPYILNEEFLNKKQV